MELVVDTLRFYKLALLGQARHKAPSDRHRAQAQAQVADTGRGTGQHGWLWVVTDEETNEAGLAGWECG